MYCKCGLTEKALEVFKEMEHKDSVSCTSFISGLAEWKCQLRPWLLLQYEPIDEFSRPAGGDNISVTIRFPCMLCITDRVFGSFTETHEVYEVAAGPVIKATMDDIDGVVSKTTFNFKTLLC